MRHESVNSPSRGRGHVPFSRLCACAKSRDVVYKLRDAFGCDVRDGMLSMAFFTAYVSRDWRVACLFYLRLLFSAVALDNSIVFLCFVVPDAKFAFTFF